MILLLKGCELLEASSGATLRLFDLHHTALLIVKQGLKVLDLLLQPGGDLPAFLDGLPFCLVQLRLHVLHLHLQVAAVLLIVLGVLLLATELVESISSRSACSVCISESNFLLEV